MAPTAADVSFFGMAGMLTIINIGGMLTIVNISEWLKIVNNAEANAIVTLGATHAFFFARRLEESANQVLVLE